MDKSHLNEVENEGARVSWKDLSYIVPISSKLPWKWKNNQKKVVLQPFTGTLEPNSLTAVMGSSGAGKTTFLNTLSYQLEGKGIREGKVYLNNQELTRSLFRKTCGYVRQDDVLIPHLTVEETLTFYANLILPPFLTKLEKSERVLATLRKLGLSHCRNTLIGNDFKKGISGGEKRRVSIAIELLKNPAVLFLDEPTSGLDSKTALSLVNTLSELAHEHNHTIICTIHQPRGQIYTQFDTLLLLAKGSPVYFGPSVGATNYFASKGYPCPEYENPPDFFIDLLTEDSDSPELFEESVKRVAFFIETSKDEGFDGKDLDIEKLISGSSPARPTPFGTIFPLQIWYLFNRSLTNSWRDKQYLFGRIIQSFVMAFAVSILWWQVDTDQSSIQDRIALIFLILICGAFPESLSSSFVFPMDRLVYLREKRSGLYSVFSYYVARQLSELPLQLIVPSSFLLIVYFCTGLQTNAIHFANFFLIAMELIFVMNSVGLLFGSIMQVQLASVFMSLFILSTMLFAGFYLNADNVPVWLRWAKYVSVFYYSFNGAIYVEFWDRDFYCKSDQYLTGVGTGTCSNGEVVSVPLKECQITTGQDVINNIGADEFSLYQVELFLLLFILVPRLLLLPSLFYPPKHI